MGRKPTPQPAANIPQVRGSLVHAFLRLIILNRSRIRKTIIFSALACMVRPTNGIIWVFLFANLFWAVRSRKKVALAILSELVTVA